MLLSFRPGIVIVVVAAANVDEDVVADGANGEAFEYLRGRIEREKGERKIERDDNDDTSD